MLSSTSVLYKCIRLIHKSIKTYIWADCHSFFVYVFKRYTDFKTIHLLNFNVYYIVAPDMLRYNTFSIRNLCTGVTTNPAPSHPPPPPDTTVSHISIYHNK